MILRLAILACDGWTDRRMDTRQLRIQR